MHTRNLLHNVVLESKLIQIGPADRPTAPNPGACPYLCKLSDFVPMRQLGGGLGVRAGVIVGQVQTVPVRSISISNHEAKLLQNSACHCRLHGLLFRCNAA